MSPTEQLIDFVRWTRLDEIGPEARHVVRNMITTVLGTTWPEPARTAAGS